uniref:BTB domain-containing protein n=1 Tax=Haemonchus placei TaxID=6290 RepID=A0A0N4WL38_HAEPC
LGWLCSNQFHSYISFHQIYMFVTYLYTDVWPGSADMLQSLRECFGCNQDLLTSLRKAEEMAFEHGDLTIALEPKVYLELLELFAAHPPEYSFRCDSSILSSRSAVFRGLLNHVGEDGRIVLDEALLPRGFAPVVVHFIYTDELDFSMVPDTIISESSLSEARAIVAGRSPHSPLHRAIQLIHIAKFFALEKLVQLCEDVIVASLCPESCVSICTWACDGALLSNYFSYLESEFSQIASTHCLFDISLESLVRCVKSQFLQATEVDVLEAVIRWGEHELLHRMEEREPNVVADTSHSISRRGVKRGDLSGAELREILAPITAHLRIDYVLPPFHQSLNAAYSRGILDRAPLRDDLVCPSTSEIIPDIHWFRPDQDAPGPRFYVPYYKRDGIACIPHPLLVVDCAFHVAVTNLMPDLISEEKFNEVLLFFCIDITLFEMSHLRSNWKSLLLLKVPIVSIIFASFHVLIIDVWRFSW